MAGVGKKKEQRRAKKAAKMASKRNNVVTLERDEWFNVLKHELLDATPVGFVMDSLLRNTVRMTSEVWARAFANNPLMLSKNLLFLQLLVIDEDRLIQGKLYGIGRDVEPGHADVIRRSRRIFKEAAPFLLKDTDSWIFSRSLALAGYDGTTDETVKFSSYDPLGDLMKPQAQQKSSSTRCAEVFFFVGGNFEVKDNGFSSRESVKQLLQELYSDDDLLNLHGCSVVAASAQVSHEKLDELKGMHLTA
ncbi:hypothetical protein vseg_005419 [Gypsophila vaccaria]